jgi:hypothetical protein
MAQITLNSTGVASNGTLALQTNGTTPALTIDASQNVGIGTGSPAAKVHASGAGASNRFRSSSTDASGVIIEMLADGTTSGVLSVNSTHPLIFQTDSTEKMRISSVGSVGVGASTTAQLRSQLTVMGAGQTTSALTDSGVTTGTIQINSSANVTNAGGALTFGALNDSGTYLPFAGIKGLLTNGGANGAGDLAFSMRGGNSDTALTERMRLKANGDFQFNSGYGSVATAYACRAWVNWDGTGTVAIRGSGNVSSITDTATGDNSVNFTTAMPDGNYSVSGSVTATGGGGFFINTDVSGSYPTSFVRIQTATSAGVTTDRNNVNVAIFR